MKGQKRDTKEGGQEEAGGVPDAAENRPRGLTPWENCQPLHPAVPRRDTEQEYTEVGEIRSPQEQGKEVSGLQQKKEGVTQTTGTKWEGAQQKVDTTLPDITLDPGEERDEAPREQAKQGQGKEEPGYHRNLKTEG